MNPQATKAKQIILGTGPLALAVMDELLAKGWPVTRVNRSGRLAEPLPAGVTLVAGDLPGKAAYDRLHQGTR